MRILTLSNVPLQAHLGSAYVTLGFADGLRGRGHQVDVVGPEVLERWQFLRRGKLQRLAWGMRSYVAQNATSGQYDVIELYGGQNCRAAGFLKRLNSRNFLVVAHSNGIEMHASERMAAAAMSRASKRKAWWNRWLDLPVRQAFTDVDGIVTVSHYDYDYALLNELQLPSRLKAIENPLPDGFIGLQVDIERQPIIGFVASWYDLKGVQAIRTALTIVLRRFDKARFRLIGTGVEFQKEKEFPADVCERVEVIGKIYDKEELRKHYQNISVLVLPSYYESFGMVATEAMACGCAVVATRTGFAAGLVDGSEALLLDRPDGNALAEALERLMSDEFLRRTIAMNGWERVQGLRWDAAVQELESTYLRWLEEVRAGVNKERTVH